MDDREAFEAWLLEHKELRAEINDLRHDILELAHYTRKIARAMSPKQAPELPRLRSAERLKAQARIRR